MSVSEMGAAPTVILDAGGGDSTIPIYVGLWEAISISNALNSEMLPPRPPITHDLIVEMFRSFEIALDSLHIDSLEEGGSSTPNSICGRDREPRSWTAGRATG
ncbi:bifunctional nuclease family protein [Methanoculleus chikugoensis]|uniref:bifunctional nuclease family protein n=1 Tax=Methanoculleus chikugoensis TaxID=118126 RepID=UPI001FB431CD|nr:bifunctional nuclease domain-containing protein [Methanoculleus chikugoensis]